MRRRPVLPRPGGGFGAGKNGAGWLDCWWSRRTCSWLGLEGGVKGWVGGWGRGQGPGPGLGLGAGLGLGVGLGWG